MMVEHPRGAEISTARETIARALARSVFVIPSINGGKLLARMLPTLNVPPECIVVVDQGSSDDTGSVCRAAGVEIKQLGSPHTFTGACNVGAEIARERSADFLFILNNDIVFVTDVAREMLAELVEDPGLAIVAPSQVLIEPQAEVTAYRVRWNLGEMRFDHDFDAPPMRTQRIEADFCELTCAAVRMSAVEEIGFLDDAYGFYHEDADFCFRLRQAGYACAYLPASQIEHWHGSSFAGMDERKRGYLSRNKARFAQKFLGYGVNHKDHKSGEANSWNIINQNLHPYLRKFGLLDPTRPELIFSHPGTEPLDYLYTVWETTRLPEEWLAHRDAYKAVFTTSRWNKAAFDEAGYRDVHYVPLGVDTDAFHPWKPVARPFAEDTFLWFASNQRRKGLDAVLAAWKRFHAARPNTRLFIVGNRVIDALGESERPRRRWKNFLIADHADRGITLAEIVKPLDRDEVADLYRGVDFLVAASRSEGFGLSIAEAMACGIVPIFAGYGAAGEFAHPGTLTLRGTQTPADYADRAFPGDVGNWWEPNVDDIVALLHQAVEMDGGTRRRLGMRGVRFVRQNFTWRNTAMSLHAALSTLQDPRDIRYRDPNEPARSAVIETSRPDSASDPEPEAATAPARRRRAIFASDEDVFANFDAAYYLRENRDVAGGKLEPLQHYMRYGWKEARYPAEGVSTIDLMRTNPEVLQRLAGRRGLGFLRRFTMTVPRAAPKLVPAPRRPDEMPRPIPAALLVGYVEAGLGIGESLRSLAGALALTPTSFAIYPFNRNVETRLIGPFMADRYDLEGRYDVNVIEMAADQLPGMFDTLGEWHTANSYNILRTYWELPAAPREWAPLLERIDEIWAPTTFVAEAFRTIFEGPITTVPTCVEVGDGANFGRDHFGMDDSVFYFMFSFDFYSSAARKNPLGVLRAFQQAFPDLTEKVGLVIKSTGSDDHNPRVRAAIATAADADPRILVLNDIMPRDEVLSLISQCDCYVSLHRSEGFGLGMAEAMAFGRAVIGTDYSGSTDFLSEETGFPVPFARRRLRDGEYVHAHGQMWAEPDEAAAVREMRRVFEEPAERSRRGNAAKALIEGRFGRDNVGRVAAARLRQIHDFIGRVRNVV